ncbi:hypothetical protein [Paludibacterium sp. B53371]|uniref:hypothetical protein n=1 Tax=Paludibacterium sp. B53371 TaxID=2806263 RepID=UPI001C048C17|nr:hypothetical protein [Paludibacterium sp. B53371]
MHIESSLKKWFSCLAPADPPNSQALLDDLQRQGIQTAQDIPRYVCALAEQLGRHKPEVVAQHLIAFKQAIHTFKSNLPSDGKEVAGPAKVMQAVQSVDFDGLDLRAMRAIRQFCRRNGALETPYRQDVALHTLSQNEFSTLGLCMAQALAIKRYQACCGGDAQSIKAKLNEPGQQSTALYQSISADTTALGEWVENTKDVLPHGYEISPCAN